MQEVGIKKIIITNRIFYYICLVGILCPCLKNLHTTKRITKWKRAKQP